MTVILVTFHSGHCAETLGRCLAHFPHVTVVDNGSTDDTVAQVRKHLPQAQVLVNAKNQGFGAANNRAIRTVDTEFVLLLNPDCLIEGAAVQTLIQTAERHPAASAIGPQLMDRKGRLDLSYCLQANGWRTRGPAAEADICVGFLSGACMLIRLAALQQVRGFDEDFFLYQEDTDLCIRMAQAHGALIVTPQARVTHFSRGSSSGRAKFKAEYIRGFHHVQSKFIFQLKHAQHHVTRLQRLRYCTVAMAEAMLRLCLLDVVRASRVWGRFMGTLTYKDKR